MLNYSVAELRILLIFCCVQGSLKQHSIFGTQINSIYGIKSSEKVKNNPISYNTTKIILVCGLFFVFLKLEL